MSFAASLFSLQGRIAIVTGVGPAMGRSIALAFAEAGAGLVLCARSIERLREVKREIVAMGGDALAVTCDLAEPDGVARLYERAISRFGQVDIIVNNAYSGPSRSSMTAHGVLDLTVEEWRQCFAVNVYAPYRLAQLAAPRMMANRWGSIINMISDSADLPEVPLAIAYGCTKAALIAQTRYLARELAPHVRVNALCPGAMSLDEESDTDLKSLIDVTPLARAGRPHEVQGAALFLASAASSYMTAEILRVDGGRLHGRTSPH